CADSAAPGGRLLLPLPASSAAVVVEPLAGAAAAALRARLAAPLQAADHQLSRELRLASLACEVDRQRDSERVQKALFAISELAVSSLDMGEVLRGIHGIVGTLMYAENFFIVLRDPADDTIELLYFVDVQDAAPFTDRLPLDELRHSYTWHVLHGRRALRGSAEQVRRQVDGPLRGVGTD